MTDKVQKIKEWIETRKLCTMDEHMAFYNDNAKEDYRLLREIEEFIKALQEEPVSEELEEVSKNYALNNTPWDDCKDEIQESFKAGAKWQKQQMMVKAIDGTARPDDNEIWCNLASSNLKDGDKVKVIVIRED